jgi:hypothetical protein
VTIKLDVSGMADGQKAGLCHFASPHFAQIGISCQGNMRSLEFKGKDTLITGPVIKSNKLWLRSAWSLDGLSQFSYSLDGKTFVPFGKAYQLAWGSYRGDRIGIYSYNNSADKGYIDVDYLHYEMKK